jgi:FKBP-type peptidyl-prolyl cis-trans isomerase
MVSVRICGRPKLKDYSTMKRIVAFGFASLLTISSTLLLAQQPQPQPQRPTQPATQPVQPQPQRPAAAAPAPTRPEAVPAGGDAAKAAPLANDKQKASYVIGLNIGQQMRSGKLTAGDLDIQTLIRGLTDGLAAAKPALTDQEQTQVMQDFQKQSLNRIKKEGEAFLAANKTKEGVKTTASGLQYKVLKSGTGAMPIATDTVTVNYKGTLLDGTVFDSSSDHGGPATFPVNRVIKGWTEALQLMKVGDKWELFIPTDLAYSDQPPTPDIPPNSMLVFEVELLGVEKGAAAQPR